MGILVVCIVLVLIINTAIAIAIGIEEKKENSFTSLVIEKLSYKGE